MLAVSIVFDRIVLTPPLPTKKAFSHVAWGSQLFASDISVTNDDKDEELITLLFNAYKCFFTLKTKKHLLAF